MPSYPPCRSAEPADSHADLDDLKLRPLVLLLRRAQDEGGAPLGWGGGGSSQKSVLSELPYDVCNSRDWLACFYVQQLAICQTEPAGPCYDPALLLPVGCRILRSEFAVSKRVQHDPALCNVFAGCACMAEPIILRHSC